MDRTFLSSCRNRRKHTAFARPAYLTTYVLTLHQQRASVKLEGSPKNRFAGHASVAQGRGASGRSATVIRPVHKELRRSSWPPCTEPLATNPCLEPNPPFAYYSAAKNP